MSKIQTVKKTAVYCRVSTKGQNLEGQRQAIQKWLDGNSITNAVWFEDTFTGMKVDRPAFNELQRGIFNGEFEAVVCYKVDRLARTMKDGVSVLCDWLERDIRVVAVTQQFDFAGVIGKTVLGLLLSLAEMEMELRRERQADGIEVGKQRGVYAGRKAGTLKVNPERIRELRTTHTIQETANALNCSVRTVCKWQKSEV
jgi:DNA invertase Pin-like site-specific DNA recombinase